MKSHNYRVGNRYFPQIAKPAQTPDDDSIPFYSGFHLQQTPWHKRLWQFFFRPKLSDASIGIDWGGPDETVVMKVCNDVIERVLLEKMPPLNPPPYMTPLKDIMIPGSICPIVKEEWKLIIPINRRCMECHRTLDEVATLLTADDKTVCPDHWKIIHPDITKLDVIERVERMSVEEARKLGYDL